MEKYLLKLMTLNDDVDAVMTVTIPCLRLLLIDVADID
jgi:hypothetical protein